MVDPLRVTQPGERRPNTIRSFLNKSPQDITVGDAFLMQVGNSLIAVLVPMSIAGFGVIFRRMVIRQTSQETQGL